MSQWNLYTIQTVSDNASLSIVNFCTLPFATYLIRFNPSIPTCRASSLIIIISFFQPLYINGLFVVLFWHLLSTILRYIVVHCKFCIMVIHPQYLVVDYRSIYVTLSLLMLWQVLRCWYTPCLFKMAASCFDPFWNSFFPSLHYWTRLPTGAALCLPF